MTEVFAVEYGSPIEKTGGEALSSFRAGTQSRIRRFIRNGQSFAEGGGQCAVQMVGESGAPAPTPRMVCSPTGLAVEGGARIEPSRRIP